MLALHRRGAEGGGVMATALWIGVVPYDAHAKRWLDDVGKHYLQNAPPGALFAIGVRSAEPGLCGETIGTGPLLGLCVVGVHRARLLQNGSVGEITMVLVPGCHTARRPRSSAARSRWPRRAVSTLTPTTTAPVTRAVSTARPLPPRRRNARDRWPLGQPPGRKSAAYARREAPVAPIRREARDRAAHLLGVASSSAPRPCRPWPACGAPCWWARAGARALLCAAPAEAQCPERPDR